MSNEEIKTCSTCGKNGTLCHLPQVNRYLNGCVDWKRQGNHAVELIQRGIDAVRAFEGAYPPDCSPVVKWKQDAETFLNTQNAALTGGAVSDVPSNGVVGKGDHK